MLASFSKLLFLSRLCGGEGYRKGYGRMGQFLSRLCGGEGADRASI